MFLERFPSGVYRVIPSPLSKTDKLVSRYTANINDELDDVRVEQFTYYFRLASGEGLSCSIADVAGANQSTIPDGQLTADDIIVFLGWYFASDPRADIGGPNQSPKSDGELTADDIIIFLNAYFRGCDEMQSVNCFVPDDIVSPCGPTPSIIQGRSGASSTSGQSNSAPAAAPMSSPAPAPAGQTPAQRIAAMQAMIDGETNPQRRAMLQAALQLLQSAPTPTPAPGTAPAPGMDDR